MKINSRLSVALHAVLHLARNNGRPMKSEELAACSHTNPVVIRRILGKLREKGMVHSEKGHGGGWTLIKKEKDISIQDICEALDETLLPGFQGPDAGEPCAILHSVSHIMEDFLEDAQALLASRLARIKMDDFLAEAKKTKRKAGSRK